MGGAALRLIRRLFQRRTIVESTYRSGAQVLSTRMAADYSPPTSSLTGQTACGGSTNTPTSGE